MNPVRTDRDVLDLAIQMGLVPNERADELRQRLDGGGTMAENVLRDAGLSPEDHTHLSYVAARIHTLMEHPSGGSNLDSSNMTPPPPGPATSTPDATSPPRNVGRYRIETMYAAGGMGRVWFAFDEVLQRSVALKDVRPEVLRPEVRRRFLEEAKITARLEHPGIIPVYDMPAGDDGPCYVMRFVRGRTLAKAMGEYHHKRQQNGGDSVEFVRLVQAFHSICQTLAYAHAQNVLHRDLKPANVLLGDFGEVLVLDWGLAKGEVVAADPNATIDQSIVETQVGQIMGTPAYMSPEQSMGDSKTLTPRSDVWSLGVILYELLTGQVPFRGSGTHDTLRMVRDDAPKPPRGLNPRAPRGLEAICAKAMAKTPADRYSGAQGLAEDVSRWLADEPVLACPEPWWQRFGRWCRRHKAIVASASALLISAVVALSVSTIFIERHRARAEANWQTALDVVETFFVKVSEDRLLDQPGMQPLRAELLREAVTFSEKIAKENRNIPARQADVARVTLLMGRVLMQLDQPQLALDTLLRARAMYAALAKANPGDFDINRGEAQANLSIGYCANSSDPKLAEQALQDAIAQFQNLAKKDPKLDEAKERLALATNLMGTLKKDRGDLDGAKTDFESAIATMADLVKAAPGNDKYADTLAGMHSNLADVWLKKQNGPNARKHLEISIAIRQELEKKGAKGLDFEDSKAASKNHLGYLATIEKRPKDAVAHFREAVRLREALVRQNPDVPKLKQSLARNIASLSQSLVNQNQYAKAIAEMGPCLEILEQLANNAPHDAAAQSELARMTINQGYYLHDSGKYDAAEKHFTKSIDRYVALGDAMPKAEIKYLINGYWTRGQTRVTLSRYDDAVADFDRALALASGPQRDQIAKEREAAARKTNKK